MKTLLTNTTDTIAPGCMIIVDEHEHKNCLRPNNLKRTIITDAKKIDVSKLPGTEVDICEYLDEKDINYDLLDDSCRCLERPNKGKYVVVYSEDDVRIGEDPHNWDYNLYVHRYFDGNKIDERYFECARGCVEVHHHRASWSQTEKRDYSVYQDRDGDYYGECNNNSYPGPALAYKIDFDKNLTDQEIEVLIDKASDLDYFIRN